MTLRSTIVTRAVAATLAVGLSFGLAACGNESTAGQDTSSTGQTGTSGDDEGYANAALAKDDIMRAAYDAAMKAGSAHMTMTMSGSTSMDATGDVAYAAKQPSMSMTMSMPQMGQGKTEMRLVGGILYMQIPGMTPPGKFAAIDPKDKTSPYAKAFAGMTDQMDPLKSIQSMEKAVQSAKRVGRASVDGEALDHYRVVVDTKALLGQLGPQAAQQAQVPDTVTYEMWLDDDNLLRRMTFDLAGAKFEAEMSDWGKPVKVQKPAAGDVVQMPAMPKA